MAELHRADVRENHARDEGNQRDNRERVDAAILNEIQAIPPAETCFSAEEIFERKCRFSEKFQGAIRIGKHAFTPASDNGEQCHIVFPRYFDPAAVGDGKLKELFRVSRKRFFPKPNAVFGAKRRATNDITNQT